MTSSLSRKLAVSIERWPIAGAFTISRGAKTEAITVVAIVSHDGESGRGECVPYPRYGETPEATLEALNAMQELLAKGLDRTALQAAMPAGAARAGLRAIGPRGQELWSTGLDPARPAGAALLHHRFHDLAGDAGSHGGSHRERRAPATLEDQARRGRR